MHPSYYRIAYGIKFGEHQAIIQVKPPDGSCKVALFLPSIAIELFGTQKGCFDWIHSWKQVFAMPSIVHILEAGRLNAIHSTYNAKRQQKTAQLECLYTFIECWNIQFTLVKRQTIITTYNHFKLNTTVFFFSPACNTISQLCAH